VFMVRMCSEGEFCLVGSELVRWVWRKWRWWWDINCFSLLVPDSFVSCRPILKAEFRKWLENYTHFFCILTQFVGQYLLQFNTSVSVSGNWFWRNDGWFRDLGHGWFAYAAAQDHFQIKKASEDLLR